MFATTDPITWGIFLEKFGLPILFLGFAIFAITVLWKAYQSKDAAYIKGLEETYNKLNDRSKQFTETIHNLTDLLKGNGRRGGPGDEK